jgi:CRP/FNR family transcriptional regulator
MSDLPTSRPSDLASTREGGCELQEKNMLTPYGMEVIENCVACKMRSERIFCNLSASVLQSFDAIKFPTAYPKGAVLFVEGQSPRGIYVLCKGQVKLTLCASNGKTLTMKMVEPGEVLGLSAAMSGKPYEAQAETLEPCQVNFVKRDDFLRFLQKHGDACLQVAEHLSDKYKAACREIRDIALTRSSSERLAKLLLDWSRRNGEAANIEQIIGTARETVSRLLSDWKKRQIVQIKGPTLLIRNKAALKALAA